MKDLMTRRIVLGMLMGLVLGFGVPGVVDAVQRPPASERADTALIDATNRKIGTDLSFTLPTLSADNTDKTDEKVTIRISSGILLTTTGHHGKSTVTLTEDGETGSDLSVTTLAGRFLTAGKQTITVSGKDYVRETTGDNIFSGDWTLTYVYYVTQPATNVSTATINLASISSGYRAAVYRDISIYGGNSRNYNVQYTPNTGLTYKIPGRTDDIAVPDGFISSAFRVTLAGDTDSEVITAQVENSRLTTTGAYFYGQPVLTVTEPTGAVDGSDTQPETTNALLTDAFSATIAGGDAPTTGLAGILVKFEVKDKTSAGGNLVFTQGDGSDGILVDSSNKQIWDAGRNALVTTGSGKILYIRTATTNGAQVDFRLGTAAEQKVTISAVGKSEEVSAFTDASENYELSVDEIQDISGKYGLYVLAERAGEHLPQGWDVVFTTARGAFEGTGTLDTDHTAPTDGGRRIVQHTDEQGIAYVIFDPKGNSAPLEVIASIKNNASYEEATAITVAQLTFDAVKGAPTSRAPTPPSGTQPARLDISVFGEDGDTSRAVIVNARNSAGQTVSISIPITLSGTALVTSQTVNTGAVTTITPPTDPDTYTLIATDPAGNYASDTETITVGGPAGEGTLDVTTVGTPVDGQQTIEVTVEDADGDAPEGEVVVTLTGPGISRTVDTVNGTGRAIIRLPNTGTTYTLRLSADGYATRSVTLSVSGVVQDDTETQTRDTTPTPSRGARSVRIASEPFPSGTANRQLAQPMRVQVLDANNNGVSNVRVTFEVVSGQGRLSQRGNGRAIRVQTDRNGNASANYTPLADGTSRVRATAAGVTQTVTFTITAGAAAPSPDETTPRETGVTPSREINPDVHVGAANRPPMLWVDGGAIYALVGADVQRFVPGVDNALNIAVGGGKVYWTEMTGESSGTINSANLNGSNAKELKSIKAVPMGIAVDTAGDKLYWTNSRGRIQSANLNGSKIENVMLDLPGPGDIAVARGILYWTQYDATEEEGTIGITNTAGRGTPKYISTGSDMPGSIAIGGNKVYWTEMTGSNSGTINSANLNGSGAEELNDIRAVPMGIGVDSSRSKLYWTNSRGRVQSANLAGRKIENIVDGLGMPGDMVLSNSIAAPAKAPTTDAEQTAATSKYDINGDGAVDSKDVDALIVAVAAGVTDAKYDVNGDGKVDIFDVSAVSSKRDAGAAAAPALLGTNLSIVQIDRLQEQIDLLVASNDRSPDTLRLLTYLHQLIVMARPEKTQLLANYPNPFNPETWIPYELATDTTVKITIYNTQGVVVRTLELGHQSAGYYTGRERAAYWDGRNALGEQVASGIYFYQFETDDMSSLRKMVILK